MVGDGGVEPPPSGPKPGVLPLYQSPIIEQMEPHGGFEPPCSCEV